MNDLAANEKKHPGGRPTKYEEKYAKQVYQLCLLNRALTIEDLAKIFDVEPSTVYNWKNEHPEFLEAIRKGREEADAHVAKSLYHRAVGYSHPEEKIFVHDGEPIRVETVKHYPPDTAAAIIWLKNRQPGLWRDKIEAEISGPNGQPIQVQAVQKLSDADLEQMIKILERSQISAGEIVDI